jgi:hypothetical protein
MLFLPKTMSPNSTCLHITQLYKVSHNTQDLAIGSQEISTPSFKFGVEYYIYFCLHKNNESESNEPVNFLERIGWVQVQSMHRQ